VNILNVDPNLTKYLIKAKILTDGVVEKPDVIGAIFGQTEGLLGEELDLRDLQKSGKIGRIEVEIDSKKGKTEGRVVIPSGLDQVETSILAASLESIDRIGPCKAKVEIESMEDVRIQRRLRIVERAKELYQKMNNSSKGISDDLIQAVKEEVEKSEILSYGEEHLPAGPAISKSDSIIVVEGRNDVLNLLKYGIKNTIAVQGTSIPKTVQELSKKRTTIVFLDGDRGGDLILKEMLQVAEVDFVARAPPGTEVEELTYKQIVKALRYKTPTEQYLSSKGMMEELKHYNEREEHLNAASQNGAKETRALAVEKRNSTHKRAEPESLPKPEESIRDGRRSKPESENTTFSLSNPGSIKSRIGELKKEKMTEVYLESGDLVASFPLSKSVESLSSITEGNTILTGGVITQRLIDIAYEKGIRSIYGVKIGQVTKKPSNMRVVAWENHT